LAALRSDNLEFFYEHNDDRVLAYIRRADEKEFVIIVVHFSPNSRDGYTLKNVPAIEGTQFVNMLNEKEIVYVNNGTNELNMNLKPFEGKILIEKKQQ
jgi:1,4-alpha-glucan branching enzyme